PAVQKVVARAAVQGVIAGAADERIRAVEARDEIVAAAAVDGVVRAGPGQGVVSLRALDRRPRLPCDNDVGRGERGCALQLNDEPRRVGTAAVIVEPEATGS